MTGKPEKQGGGAGAGERKKRLAEALRANLRKRKQGPALDPGQGSKRGEREKTSASAGENLS